MCCDVSVARMVDAVEVQLSTDFAGLSLEQDPGTAVLSGPYATSAPGTLAMKAGTKYSDMDVRVESWDAQPPPPGDLWEDQDVLPWRSINGASEAYLRGFDEPPAAVALAGLERARVEVLAWGRNRYDYGTGPDDPDEIPRERWLLRFWPDLEDLDALAGPPRRLIDRSWLPAPRSAFHTSREALRTTGWWSPLLDAPFSDIFQALYYHEAAFRMEELPQAFLRWTWETPVTRTHSPYGDTGFDSVSRAAGIEILTYRDAMQALIALGVFATVQTPDGELLVPNPAPPIRAWEVVERVPDTGYSSPRALEFAAYRKVSEDLLHLARWAKDGVLRATPERIASRLGLSLDETLGALNFLAGVGDVVEPMPDKGVDTRSEIVLSPA
jgi:hypothetical protein